MKEFVKNLLLSILGYFLIGYPIMLLFGAVVALTGKDPLTTGLFMEAFKWTIVIVIGRYALWGVVWLAVEIWDMADRVRDHVWMYKKQERKNVIWDFIIWNSTICQPTQGYLLKS